MPLDQSIQVFVTGGTFDKTYDYIRDFKLQINPLTSDARPKSMSIRCGGKNLNAYR